MGPGRLLILSGQVGARPDGSLPEDGLEQLDGALDNIERNLAAAGMGFEDVIKLTWFLVGDFDVPGLRQRMRDRFQGHKPCSTLLFVAGLASPDYKVEIEAWASRSL